MKANHSPVRSVGGAGLGALLAAVLCLLGATGCAPPVEEQGTAAVIALSSASIPDNVIPKQYTCDGAGISPALSWSAAPPGTQSYVMIMNDRDSIVGRLRRHLYAHWLMYDLPGDAHQLPEGIAPQQQTLADGSRQGKKAVNDFGYGGPCPDNHIPHHYVFTLYALDVKPDLPIAASEREIRKAMQGHVIGRGQLVTTYQR